MTRSTSEKTVQIDIPLVLPEIEDGQDACLDQLLANFARREGVYLAHVRQETTPPQLCLHFDPDQITPAAVERLVRESGAEFTSRVRHETIAMTGLDTADAGDTLAALLADLPGMRHARVNVAAGLVFVAYDIDQLTRPVIEQTLRRFGVRPLPLPAGDESDHHPAFFSLLPAWVGEQQELFMIGLAGLFLLLGWLGETVWGFSYPIILALYILSYLAAGFDLARHAVPALLKGNFDTDVLMLAAALGAAVLGEWAEGGFLLFLFGLGHAGEHLALDRARHAVSALGELMPATARVKLGDQLVERPVDQLEPGDLIVVRPGDRLPADGRINHGRSAIDQSPITGESVPVEKGSGAAVFAGTINQSAALEIEVTARAADNTLSRVMRMVQEAQAQQSPTQRFTSRFTARFVPAVLLLTLLVIVAPPLLGWMSLADSFYRGMILLVAASPCALAIGTPAAVLSGIARAARGGVLIKGGAHLENLGELEAIAFDKTGTLTAGRFTLTDLFTLNGHGPEELLRTAAAVEQQANHPLARAVVAAAEARELSLPAAAGLEQIDGRGVRSTVDGRPVLIGSTALFQETNGHRFDDELLQTIARFEREGKTTMTVSREGELMGVLALADTPRPGVKETLERLQALGIKHLVMLTGDNEAVARKIGRAVGVTDVRARLLPEEKLAAIEALQQRYGSIAMAGDGVNDAPALAGATVGIAMGGAGTAVALETADVALMGDDLSRLPFAVGLSRAGRAIIRQNLAIALGVIALLILTSVLGIVPLGAAVVLHEGSTIAVVLNALRLLRYEG